MARLARRCAVRDLIAERWEDLDTFDPSDPELLLVQDEVGQRWGSWPRIAKVQLREYTDSQLARFILDLRNAVKLPLFDDFIDGMSAVLIVAEEIAKERLVRREKAERRMREWGKSDWASFDLLGAVRDLTGEHGIRRRDEHWFKCPWHEDSQPSLEVNEVKRTWHCWAGCGAGGVIDFKKRVGL